MKHGATIMIARRTPNTNSLAGFSLFPETCMDMTFRILGPHERGRFAPEAWGHLLALKESGALSRAELEQVIDRALSHLEGRIALDDLRALLDSVSYEDGTSVDSPTVH